MVEIPLFESIISIFALVGFSIAVAMFRGGQDFSLNVMLSSLSIGMAILVWIPVVPQYLMVFSALAMIGMLFSDRGESSE